MCQLRTSEKGRGHGIFLILLSTLSFGFMQIFVAMTGDEIHIMEQTFFRNLIGLIVIGILVKRDHISFFGERQYQPQLIGRSLFGFLGVILLFYAARNALQADVTIITRISMFTITAVSVIFLHEKLTKIHIPTMFIAFIGAFIAANPSFDSSFLPLLSAFGCAICNTVAYTLLSYLAGKVNPLTVIMHFCVFSTVASIPFMLSNFVIPTGWNLFCLLMIGTFGAIGQITMTFAYRHAPAGEISIYNQSSIPINAMLGFLFLHEMPTIRSLIGGILVLSASVMLFYYNQNVVKQQATA